MNQFYPDRHHPIYFLQDVLEKEAVPVTFHRDDLTRGLWGLGLEGRIVVWLIDIRWQHERDAHEANIRLLQDEGALVMAAQKPDAEYFGCKWLPLAATPGYAPPQAPVKKLVDIAMVGYIRDIQREQVLLDLNRDYSVSVTQGTFGDAAISTYHQARLAINIPTRYGDPRAYDSGNMRCYEILATGTPLVTPYEDYLAELGITDGFNAFTYRNRQACLDKVQQALTIWDLEAIGQEAIELIQERHTYAHRAKQVLEWLA